jgi:hypothetical protein
VARFMALLNLCDAHPHRHPDTCTARAPPPPHAADQ